jgi:hypothetical protein
MKIAIVGPELSKWKSKEQIEKVKQEISNILLDYHVIPVNEKFSSYKHEILVSGHCPKGGVDIWAEEIADELGIKKEIYPTEVNQWEDKNYGPRIIINPSDIGKDNVLKGYKSRNIQIAEACDMLYCIVPRTTLDNIKSCYDGCGAFDTCGLPLKDCNQYCIHCKERGHQTNGGCWTMKYAKKLGKETHLVVIE